MTRIISIDPGLATTALARWTVRRWSGPGSWVSAPAEAKLDCLAGTGSFTTNGKKPLAHRLLQIHEFVIEQCETADLILIEEPAVAGAYAERRGRQRTRSQLNAKDMASFNRALGVVIAAAEQLAPGKVELVKASQMPKLQRHAILAGLLAKRKHQTHQPRNGHERDAVWVGLADPWLVP